MHSKLKQGSENKINKTKNRSKGRIAMLCESSFQNKEAKTETALKSTTRQEKKKVRAIMLRL